MRRHMQTCTVRLSLYTSRRVLGWEGRRGKEERKGRDWKGWMVIVGGGRIVVERRSLTGELSMSCA